MADPFADSHPLSAGGAVAPSWRAALRSAGSTSAESADLPDASQEDWRHTDPSRIPWGPDLALGGEDPGDDVVRSVADRLGARAGLLLTWGGGARVIEAPGQGVGMAVLDTADDPGCGRILSPDTDVFAAVNAARFTGGAFLRFDAGTRTTSPVVVVHWAGPSDSVSFPRTFVSAGAGAEAAVVEVWAGDAGAVGNLVDAAVELDVGEGAHLDHVALQEVGDATAWICNQAVRVARDARIRTTAAALGASVSRMRSVTTLSGEGGEADAVGVYVESADRHADFRITQRHVAPRCRSDLRYHGAVWDEASSVFSGLIRIEPEAAHSDAHQASRYLLLSEQARAANIPTLEIFNHDVRCGHASSGGPPDEDQLYYLQARAIPPDVAERLVVDGFFAEVTGRIRFEDVRGHVGAEIQRRLAILRGKEFEADPHAGGQEAAT